MDSHLIIDILSNPIALFLASIFFTLSSFYWTKKLLCEFRPSFFGIALFFGICNGAIAVGAECFVAVPIPAVMMMLVPLLTVLEIRLVSRDGLLCYLFLLASYLINFSAIHNISVGTMGLLPMNNVLSRMSMEYRIAIFSVILLVAAGMQVMLTNFMSSKELYVLMHTPEKSALLLLYMSVSSVVLMVASSIMAPLLFSDTLPRTVIVPVCIDFLLKALLILTCSYMIAILHFRSERIAQQNIALSGELQQEKKFRSTIRQQAMMSYSFNATKNQMLEGAEQFEDCLRGDSPDDYRRLLSEFAKACVHPGDRETVLRYSKDFLGKERLLEDHRTEAARFRLSLRCLREVTNLPELEACNFDEYPEWTWFEARATFVVDSATGDTISYVDFVDVDEQVEKERRLLSAARYDAVTGILNRATLEEGIREYLAQEQATGAMFMIDMDNFKQVNDSFGHIAGDGLLKEMALVVRSVFHPGDIVGRIGGDEFCVFALGLHDRGAIVKRAQSLVASTWRSFTTEDGDGFDTGVSVGIAICPEDSSNYEVLYNCSDIALYQAKVNGKNSFCFYQQPD